MSTTSDLFSPTSRPTPSDGTLIFRLEIDGKLPSLNELFGMEHWERKKFKDQLADAFLCALQQSESASSMRITSSQSSTSIYSATLESYRATKLIRRLSKRAKGKPVVTKKSRLSSKSTNCPSPPEINDSPFE